MTETGGQDAALDELYGAPLDEFVAARDALSARLREEGDAAAAVSVKKARKPTLPAWAVNQLVRRRGPEIEELISARQRLRDAPGPAEMRDATQQRRRLVQGLVDAAASLLSDAGHAPSSATLEKVSQTLYAATDDVLRGGCLTKELQGGGLEELGFVGLAEGEVPASEPGVDDEVRRRVADARVAVEETERRVRELEEDAATAERRAREAWAVAEAARKERDAAREALERAERGIS